MVFAYLTSDQAGRLQEKFGKELKKGARVVTISFNLPDWEHAYLDKENLIFLYEKQKKVPSKDGTFLDKLAKIKRR